MIDVVPCCSIEMSDVGRSCYEVYTHIIEGNAS